MKKLEDWTAASAAIIVAHPDDETLWSGGTILSQPQTNWEVVCLCRSGDPDRAPRFFQVLEHFGAAGAMGDLDDGPEQTPLPLPEIQNVLLNLLSQREFDLVLTHSPRGEYTRHRRHEETSQAVIELWGQGQIETKELWLFAYEDGGGKYRPRAIPEADCFFDLEEKLWAQKYRLITEVYGFPPGGFEAETTPRSEAFWRFRIQRELFQSPLWRDL